MKIGYARVSKLDQHPALQEDALKQAGCEKLFVDHCSGSRESRPQWDRCLDTLREGDTLVVWRLDRAGRSLRHLIDLMTALEQRAVHFQSLTEGIATDTCTGRLVFHIFGAIAQFERELIVERTKAGLAAARARGRKGGRKPKLDTKGVKAARALYGNKELSISEVCQQLRVSKATLYRAIKD